GTECREPRKLDVSFNGNVMICAGKRASQLRRRLPARRPPQGSRAHRHLDHHHRHLPVEQEPCLPSSTLATHQQGRSATMTNRGVRDSSGTSFDLPVTLHPTGSHCLSEMARWVQKGPKNSHSKAICWGPFSRSDPPRGLPGRQSPTRL